MVQPSLIVFDLDFTLWDCGGTWCDCLHPPFQRRGHHVVDSTGRVVRLYDDVHAIMDRCDDTATPMALASRTEQPDWARELVELLGVAHRFSLAEIYPTSKYRHFSALREASGIPYEKMLFFDDEMRNITEVSRLGVACVHVGDGMTADVYQAGVRQFQESSTSEEK